MASGGRLALVIGNSNYADAPLINPVNDATDMASKLSALGFEVIKQTNVDRQGMRMAIRDFGNRLKDVDVGLFYYAGHGVQIKGVNYLVPLRADINSADEVQDESIEAGSVLRKMETAGNKVNIVILDACRNNPFASSFRSLNRGLARMDGPVGSFIAYATSPGAVAADGDGRNGLYTQYLLEAMGQPGLSIEQVFKQVRNQVVSDTSGKQTPWESSSLMGEFVFSGEGARYTPPVLNAPPVQPVSVGHVQVISNIPWASVTINNQAKGKVDADGVLNISQIQGKSAAISVSSPGYLAYARNIEIIPNQWQQVYATLKRAEKQCYVDKKVALAMQVELLGTKKKKLRPVHRRQLQSFISNALTQNQIEVLAPRYKERADYDVQAYITINVLPITQIKTSFKTVDISIVLELMDRDTGKTLSQLSKVYRKAGSSADEVFQKVLRNNMVPVMRSFLAQVCE
ncbi:MAG: hypothetical protein methR_P3078 [Methyloprofundus sp.]|nr:MAG: hypothetical protein methR_P3078 [Methyloprofundus sp.]